MRCRSCATVAGLVLLLLVGSRAALATCADPGRGWSNDPPDLTFVSMGATYDAGQISALNSIQGHGRISTGALFMTWAFDDRRILDPAGNTVNDNVRSITTGSNVFDGCSHSPPLPGCRLHGWYYDTPTTSGAYDWQGALQNRAAQPGTYRLQVWYDNAEMHTYTRTFGVATTVSGPFVVKDQNGIPVQGAVYTTTSPTVLVWPATDANGATTRSGLAPADYNGTWTGPDFTALPHIYTINSSSGTIQVVVQRTAQNPSGKGNVSLKVVNGDDAANPAITGATVALTGVGNQTTPASGTVLYSDLTPATYAVSVAASGFQSGAVSVVASNGVTRNYVVKMHASSAPTLSDTTGDDPGFWEKLFVPKAETCQGFSTLMDSIKAWGPFGFITACFSAFNSGTRAGEQELVWSLTFDPFGGAAPPWQGKLDLRPLLAPADPDYTGGGRGSIAGNFLAGFRVTEGLLVWGLFMFAVVRWMRPRMSA